RHANLWPSVHVNSSVAFARNRAGDVVANSQSAKSFPAAFAQSAERVRGFAALTDRENKCLGSHWSVSMAKLAGVFNFGRNAGKSLNQIFAHSSSMKSCAASGKDDTPDVAELWSSHIQAAQLCSRFVRIETTAHGIAHCVRLLKNFFEHVMRVIT